MDFSEAQRNGFIEAFVKFWSAPERSSPAYTAADLRTIAAKLLREHFRANATRVSRINAVVPPESADQFKSRTLGLLDVQDATEFLQLASELLNDFPKIGPWLSWWLRPEHASMLFTSHRVMAATTWESIPDTTNAEESMHHKIYSGLERDHTFLDGLEALYRFAEYYETRTKNTLREPTPIPHTCILLI